MFKKVLVAEDMQDITKGVYIALCELGIEEINQVQYCDDAYLKILKGVADQLPFELLITDLSFKSDHREQKFSSGEALIKTLKQEYPSLKIIVYSIEDRLQKVRNLIKEYQVDGYVCKSRRGLSELTQAIGSVYQDQLYLSPEVAQALSPRNHLEIDDYDIQLLQYLSSGLSQEDISVFFKQKGIKPSSLSSIEKRLNKLRIDFKANNAIHLIATVKDLGLI